jgi:hypothetical protein
VCGRTGNELLRAYLELCELEARLDGSVRSTGYRSSPYPSTPDSNTLVEFEPPAAPLKKDVGVSELARVWRRSCEPGRYGASPEVPWSDWLGERSVNSEDHS